MIESAATLIKNLMPFIIALGILGFSLAIAVLVIGSIVLFAIGYSEKDYSELKKFSKVCGIIIAILVVWLFLSVTAWGLINILTRVSS